MASEYYERPYNLVNTQIAAMSARADDALNTAQQAIDKLLNIPLPQDGANPPNLDMPPSDIPSGPSVQDPSDPTDMQVSSITLPDFDDIDGLLAGLDTTIGEIPLYDPPVTAIAIPPKPAPIDTSGAPESPDIVEPALPERPSAETVALGELLAIVPPEFGGLNLPTFDAEAPEFTAVLPNTNLVWTPQAYTSPSLTALQAKIATMLAGGTGLPPVIEQALFDRTRARADVEGERRTQEAFHTYAARGFDMPPGMLVEAVDLVRENNRLDAATTNRDILVQAATWEIENLRFAVTQGIALETQLILIFNGIAERTFLAARLRVESDISLYNSQVTLFGALNAAYTAKAQVYGELIKGELAKLEEYKQRIEAEKLKGQVNEQTVKIFGERIEASKQLIERYKAEMQGVQALSDLNKNRVERYRAETQAYAERMGAEKTRFDAYKTEIEGEAAKTGLLEASSRAYAATVQAFEGKANIRVNLIRARVEAMNSSTQRYVAKLQAERERVNSDTEIVKARLQLFLGKIEKWKVALGDRQSERTLKLQQVESRLRNNIAAFEIYSKQYDSGLTRMIQEMTVRVEALKTVASATSQIAAGAFSAMHVSASMEGGARVSDSYSREDRYTFDGNA